MAGVGGWVSLDNGVEWLETVRQSRSQNQPELEALLEA